MPAKITRHATIECALCYLDSASRVAETFKETSPLMRDTILREASARVTREGLTAVRSAHASHTRRTRPWPSDKPAAA